MTVKMIEQRICDLCEIEDGKEISATCQYSNPDLCKKHADQMRNTGGYEIRHIK